MVENATAATFDLAVRVARPPEQVFGWLTDIQDHEPLPARARVRMVKEPPGPTRVGTRWHERVRMPGGWWLRVESVVTAVEEPRRLEMDFRNAGFSGHLAYLLAPAPGGTLLRQRETLRLRALVRPFATSVERSLGTHLVQRLDDVRAALEAAP